ncbi:hypothetical protein [Bacillus pinisoli]|uniref:hypothetical protein n=1 Tax=Bacillus pinisoli TaxID=2901866 RepID=UPI001FF1AE7D|nr:hypothetical protein [Bacillus pinisoli]
MKKKTIPFIVLTIIHGFFLLLAFVKKGNKTFLVLNVSIGIAYIFEYFVLNVLKMYFYYPKVFKVKWIDSVFGALLSQSLFIPIASTLIVLFKVGWKGRILVALIYGVIERLFISWGVFRNFTWSTLLTITTMPLYFNQVKKWWRDIEQGHPLKLKVSVFLSYWINYTNILYFSLALLNKYRFRIGILRDQYWEHFILVPIYTLIVGTIGTISTIYFRNPLKIICLLLLHLLDRFLYKWKLIRPSSNKDLYLLIPIHASMLLLGEYFFRSIKKMAR